MTTQPTEIMSFDDAIAKAKNGGKQPILLLGNGFTQAAINSIAEIPPESRQNIITSNLDALKSITEGLTASRHFEYDMATLTALTSSVRRELLKVIISNHPASPYTSGLNTEACAQFLQKFIAAGNSAGQIYTLNYDLLLYWVFSSCGDALQLSLKFIDGFGRLNPGADHPLLYWKHPEKQNIFYLHGALHLYYSEVGKLSDSHDLSDSKIHLLKFGPNEYGATLMEQIRGNLNRSHWQPLYVLEGTEQDKYKAILVDAYLQHAYGNLLRKTQDDTAALFIFGCSFNENDEHIWRHVLHGQCQLFVSLYGSDGDPRQPCPICQDPHAVPSRLAKMSRGISFFCATSAKVWG